MVPRVGVGGVGRDDVAEPDEQATRTNPQARRNDEPQDTGQEATVIELSNSRDDRAQNCRYSRIAHCYLLFLSLARPCPTSKNVSRSRHTRHRSTDLFWLGQLFTYQPSNGIRRGGAVHGTAPIPLASCSPVLPDESAGQEPAGHQESTRAQREQRSSAATTALRQLLRSRRRRRSRRRSLGRSKSGHWRRGIIVITLRYLLRTLRYLLRTLRYLLSSCTL